MAARPDTLIIGGGVIGLSTAYFLAAEAKQRVTVVERGEFGREASWAGAGIIQPANRAHATTPLNQLLGLSNELFPDLSHALQERTGIDNGYRRCGGVELASGVTDAQVQEWRAEGIASERMNAAALRRLETALSPAIEDGYYQPDMAQVRNPRHLRALLAGCDALGVELRSHTVVHSFRSSGERIDAVQTDAGELNAERFLVASGAWSARLLEPLGLKLDIFPVRGQIVLFNPVRALLKMIVSAGHDYLVPRADGRILAGSTEEDAGFVKETTREAFDKLTSFARSLVPALAEAPVETTWCGLRPATRRGLPYLGQLPGTSNLYIAAGHFRSGLMLSAATGRVMAELLTGQAPSVPLDAFSLPQ